MMHICVTLPQWVKTMINSQRHMNAYKTQQKMLIQKWVLFDLFQLKTCPYFCSTSCSVGVGNRNVQKQVTKDKDSTSYNQIMHDRFNLFNSSLSLREGREIVGNNYSTLRPTQNGWHFADDNFNCIFLQENCCNLIQISMMRVAKGPIDK